MASKRVRGHDTEAYSSSGATSAKKKKGKVYCDFKSSWKSQHFSIRLRDGEVKSISGDVLSGVDGEDTAKCKVCGVTFFVRHGGANDVVKHFSSQNHLQAMSSTCSTHTLAKFGFGQSEAAKRARRKREEEQMQVQKAETLFVQFVAEHNLPFRIGAHFTKLVKGMFPADIARQFQCSHTKTSVLVCYGNGSFCHDKLVETLTSTTPVYYSLLVDESNDRGVDAKDLVVLLRFFDPSAMKAVTRFIDLPTANDGTAATYS